MTVWNDEYLQKIVDMNPASGLVRGTEQKLARFLLDQREVTREMEKKCDALVVQNDALRREIWSMHKAMWASEHEPGKGVRCETCDVLALDTPHAAKIAEVRRRVCEAASSLIDSGYGRLDALFDAVAELRKLESEHS